MPAAEKHAPSFGAVAVLAMLAAPLACSAQSGEWRGLLDMRANASDTARSWVHAGTGKSRYDRGSSRVGAGQAVLQGEADLANTMSASATISADGQRSGGLDVREAWLGWNPLPSGPWRLKAKAGAFFPPSSVEIDYAGIGWTPVRTVSSSAINSWIGEELRTRGMELQLTRTGRYEGRADDFGLLAAVFQGNDPAGTLLAWRGWSISDRIAGNFERMRLPDLPVYRADGAIPRQSRTLRPFREIDGRMGYYAAASYRHGEQLELAWLHYDNRADPVRVEDGQYGWRTRFEHVSLVARPHGTWELLFQYMRGDTLMGKNAVALDYHAWYALLSRSVGPGRLALRYDKFKTTEHDLLPDDPNAERGRAVAVAYSVALGPSSELVTELLALDSRRAARTLVGEAPRQIERSIVASVRWQF